MPYQVAIALALALILVILTSYRLGQFSYQPQEQKPAQPSGLMRQVEQENQTERAAMDLPPSLAAPIENNTPKIDAPDSEKIEAIYSNLIWILKSNVKLRYL